MPCQGPATRSAILSKNDAQPARLFGDTSDKKALRLTDSKMVGDGVAILIYEPAGERASK